MLQLDLLECYYLACITVLRLVDGSVCALAQLRLTFEAAVALLWWVANIIAHLLVYLGLGLFLAVGILGLLLLRLRILFCLHVHLHNEISFLLNVFLHWNVNVFVVHRLVLSY